MTNPASSNHGSIARMLATGAAVVACYATSGAYAFTWESLLMPGPVADSHAEIEDDCVICHIEDDTVTQDALCGACHVEVAADIEASTGFHGRSPDARAQDCAMCHGEHEGRAADIVGIDIPAFNHAFTDFALRGAHTGLACTSCHEEDAGWAGIGSTCSQCHAEDDVHMGRLGADCAGCHGETAWQSAIFDHASTGFLLTGAHEALTCSGCHRNQVFVETPTECVGCHRQDDTHMGRNGEQCASCHATSGWTELRFDHLLVSTFALEGAHGQIACEACHTQNLAARLDRQCIACHRADDVHAGGLGANCADCHGPVDWSGARFDHAAMTSFDLLGAHAQARCESCHASSPMTRLATDCASCHRDDPHRGQLGTACESCHSEIDWHQSLGFDHGLTTFPLIGMHLDIECGDCHETAAFHDAGERCESCHASDDAHMGRLGSQCETCHNPSGWDRWRFDHDLQTAFALTGAHSNARCEACHREPSADSALASAGCQQCHRRDDPHTGSFGSDCGVCHTTTSFTELERF